MKKKLTQLPVWIAYFFILLFCYAAISKVFDFENFQVQIAQSPLLSAYAEFVSYAVIIIELLIVLALIFTSTKRLGLYASLGIMVAFTVYIFLILNYSEFIPCSCGGILEKDGLDRASDL
nr:MauE/DoxX family redox-associated membrane protein [Elizabethkingia bruuniana]